ncbi:MAG: transposase [Cyanobacteria bacterium P01_F01_bin.53]
MLKLYLYGYSNRTRSSRQLERACHINMEVIWLMRRLRPDHKTIAEFRRKHSQAFKHVFRQFVVLCRRLNLVAGELVAIDGTQLKAVNNPAKNLTRNKLKRQIKEADQQIEAYMSQLDDADAREKGGRRLNRKQLKQKLKSLENELESMRTQESEMEAKDIQQISQTDPQSRSMAKNPRIGVGYNAQASADAKHGLIVAEDLSNAVHDYDQLEPMVRQTQENLETIEGFEVTADKGYDKASQINAVEEMGCRCHIPSRRNSKYPSSTYTRDAFRYLKTKDAYRCPAGALLEHQYDFKSKNGLRRVYANPQACQGCVL